MDRDELVERVAEERHTRRNTYMDETKEVIHSWAHVVSQAFHAKYVETLRADARTALAIIEPAVRGDERERCMVCGPRSAAAIRAGAKP